MVVVAATAAKTRPNITSRPLVGSDIADDFEQEVVLRSERVWRAVREVEFRAVHTPIVGKREICAVDEIRRVEEGRPRADDLAPADGDGLLRIDLVAETDALQPLFQRAAGIE